MKTLKWLGVFILSVMLFILLTLLGNSIMIKATLLNPAFLPREINKLPLSAVTKQVTENITDMPENIRTAINQIVADIEPQLKTELGSGISQIYDYLQGKKPNPELANTLRTSILSNKFVSTLIDNLPLASLGADMTVEQLQEQGVPDEFVPLLDYIEPAFTSAEPLLKGHLKNAAPPILDYLLGITKSVRVTLNLQPVYDHLIPQAKEYFMEAVARENPSLSPAQVDAQAEQLTAKFTDEVLSVIPVSYVIDEKVIGTTAPSEISSGIKSAENILAQSLPYIKLFNRYFIPLIVLTILFAVGIILIIRSVKSATRTLGIVFMVYGALWGCILIFGKYLLSPRILKSIAGESADANIYPDVLAFLQQFSFDIIRPLEIFTFVILIFGIVLLIFSLMYNQVKAKVLKKPNGPGI